MEKKNPSKVNYWSADHETEVGEMKEKQKKTYTKPTYPKPFSSSLAPAFKQMITKGGVRLCSGNLEYMEKNMMDGKERKKERKG